MVLIIDGNSGIGAHMWSEIGNLISLRHFFLIESIRKTGSHFEKDLFSFTRAQEVLSYHLYKNHALPRIISKIYPSAPASVSSNSA